MCRTLSRTLQRSMACLFCAAGSTGEEFAAAARPAPWRPAYVMPLALGAVLCDQLLDSGAFGLHVGNFTSGYEAFMFNGATVRCGSFSTACLGCHSLPEDAFDRNCHDFMN